MEIPSYNGNRLNGVKRQRLAKKFTRNIDLNGKIHKPDLLFVEVLRNVQSLYGNEKYAAHVHILPHFEKSGRFSTNIDKLMRFKINALFNF